MNAWMDEWMSEQVLIKELGLHPEGTVEPQKGFNPGRVEI